MLLKNIKDLAKDTSIYGVGKVIGQVVGFFLIPLYTSYFTAADYGILAILGVSITTLSLVMTYAMDSAAYKYVGLSKEPEEMERYAFNAHAFVMVAAMIPTLIVWYAADWFSLSLLENGQLIHFIWISYAACLFSTISCIPRAVLRIQRRAKTVALASLINVFISIVITVGLVVVFETGILGAIIGNAAGNLSASLILSMNVKLWKIQPIDINIQKELIVYAAPMLPHKVFAFLIPLYAQIALKNKLDLSTLGLYALALKFTVPYVTFISMFQQAWAPYKFEILRKDTEPVQKFRSLTDLYVLFSITIYVLIATVGQFGLELMATKEFHQASQYLPIMALIPFCHGLYFIFGTGNEFADSPIWKPVISGVAIISFVLLIELNSNPSIWTIAGSIALSYLIMAIGNLIYARTLFKINYNWRFLIPLIFGIPFLVTFLSFQLLNSEYRYINLFVLAIFVIFVILALVRMNFKTINYKKLMNT